MFFCDTNLTFICLSLFIVSPIKQLNTKHEIKINNSKSQADETLKNQ
jgi:hypothetical protein